MFGRIITSLVLFLLVCLCNLFAGEQPKKMPSLPGASAEDVTKYIFEKNPYRKWRLFPGTKALHPGLRPDIQGTQHGEFLTTYVNDIAYKAIVEKEGFPDGSIIVEENYGPDFTLTSIDIMYKVRGYDPKAGNWMWVKSMPHEVDGRTGKMAWCVNCHAQAKGGDYIYQSDREKWQSADPYRQRQEPAETFLHASSFIHNAFGKSAFG